MRYLWLAGLLAVAGLVLAAGLRAEESAPRGEGVRSERRAEGEGRTGEARGGRTRAPEVKLTAEQETELAPAVTELKAAIAKFKAAAVKVLGEKDGPAYAMRAVGRLTYGERTRGTEKKPEGGTEK